MFCKDHKWRLIGHVYYDDEDNKNIVVMAIVDRKIGLAGEITTKGHKLFEIDENDHVEKHYDMQCQRNCLSFFGSEQKLIIKVK
jgi:hypothetical protein